MAIEPPTILETHCALIWKRAAICFCVYFLVFQSVLMAATAFVGCRTISSLITMLTGAAFCRPLCFLAATVSLFPAHTRDMSCCEMPKRQASWFWE